MCVCVRSRLYMCWPLLKSGSTHLLRVQIARRASRTRKCAPEEMLMRNCVKCFRTCKMYRFCCRFAYLAMNRFVTSVELSICRSDPVCPERPARCSCVCRSVSGCPACCTRHDLRTTIAREMQNSYQRGSLGFPIFSTAFADFPQSFAGSLFCYTHVLPCPCTAGPVWLAFSGPMFC